jgi:hypothetical protein
MKPFGRSKELVPCHAITMDALLHDVEAASAEELSAYKNDLANNSDDGSGSDITTVSRECLWSETMKILPTSMFEYDAAALKRAVNGLRSAYGKVACIDEISYEPCTCVNEITGQSINHAPGECLRISLVIVKIAYTTAERQRRKDEENEIYQAFQRITNEIEEFVSTLEGRRQIKNELKKRKATYSIELSECGIKVSTLKADIKIKLEHLNFQQSRREQFRAGQPLAHHSLHNTAEVSVCVCQICIASYTISSASRTDAIYVQCVRTHVAFCAIQQHLS